MAKERKCIYFFLIEGKTVNLRSHLDAKKYCLKNNIRYDLTFFNFYGKDKYSGPEQRPEVSKSPELSDEESEVEPEINIVGVRIARSFKEAVKSDQKED